MIDGEEQQEEELLEEDEEQPEEEAPSPEPEEAPAEDADEAARQAAEDEEIEKIAAKNLALARNNPLELARMHARASRVIGRQGNEVGAARKERDALRKAFENAGGVFDAIGNPIIPKAKPEPAAPAPVVDPSTGFHVDPATSRKVDPKTGNYIQPVRAADGTVYEQLFDRYGVEIVDDATLKAIEDNPQYGPQVRADLERSLEKRRTDARLKEIDDRINRTAIDARLPSMRAEAEKALKADALLGATPTVVAAFERAWLRFEALPANQMTGEALDFLHQQELSKNWKDVQADISATALRIAQSQIGNPKIVSAGSNGASGGNGNGTGNGTATAVRLTTEERMVYDNLKKYNPKLTPAEYRAQVEDRQQPGR
jgi:hypothetical protein